MGSGFRVGWCCHITTSDPLYSVLEEIKIDNCFCFFRQTKPSARMVPPKKRQELHRATAIVAPTFKCTSGCLLVSSLAPSHED